MCEINDDKPTENAPDLHELLLLSVWFKALLLRAEIIVEGLNNDF